MLYDSPHADELKMVLSYKHEGDIPMKKLLLIVALVVASAAPALAEEFANPYSCLVSAHCR